MYRYVAFLWNVWDAAATASAARLTAQFARSANNWTRRTSEPGLAVWDFQPERHGLQPYVLAEHGGVILGRLFPTNLGSWSPGWKVCLDGSIAANIVKSGGRELVENYWGSYVAFLHDSQSRCHYAIRDCSGKIPCYTTTHHGVHLVFADVRDITSRLDLPSLGINWRYLAAFIHFSELQIRESSLNNIEEILAGECLVLRPDSKQWLALWDPRRICRSDAMEDRAQAITQLRSTTKSCVGAWSSAFSSILHSLSGGFDSAVVLECIRQAPSKPRIICLNRYTVDSAGDERGFARLAAARAHVELIEHPWHAGQQVLDETLIGAYEVVKPSVASLFGLLDVDFRNSLLDNLSADVLWTGEGGDHLFFVMRSALGAADFVRRHGIGCGLRSAVADASHLAREPYWATLRKAISLARQRTSWMPEEYLNRKVHFLNSYALPDSPLDYSRHPWADDMEDLPKGKQFQILLLSELLNRHRPVPGLRQGDEHHPLLSQPLMNLCLRIPVYRLVEGGKPRGLARSAFQTYLPPEIFNRESKGETSTLLTGILRQSTGFLCDLLLDGALIRERILDRQSLESYLLRGQPLRNEQLFPLFASIAAEVWVQSWSNKASRAAA
jgi:asparagine synthase (glutamine-hydrolysing)